MKTLNPDKLIAWIEEQEIIPSEGMSGEMRMAMLDLFKAKILSLSKEKEEKVTCEDCSGDGKVSFEHDWIECESCDGTGKVSIIDFIEKEETMTIEQCKDEIAKKQKYNDVTNPVSVFKNWQEFQEYLSEENMYATLSDAINEAMELYARQFKKH